MSRGEARIRRKMREQGGLTVLELLVTVLLVTLVGGIIAATVDLAAGQFRDRTQEADAQLLCSALSLFVQSELTYAGDVEMTGGTLTFTDRTHKFGPGCSFAVSDEGHLVLQYPGGSYEIVGAGSYQGRKTLKVQPSIKLSGKDKIAVTIAVADANAPGGKPLAECSFQVKAVAP